jgi:hypothetical protein
MGTRGVCSTPSAAEVPIPAEVEVSLGSGVVVVPRAAAESGYGEVILSSTAPASSTPLSYMLRFFLARPFSTYCIHKRRKNPT